MYIEWDDESALWIVFNHRDKGVASFASKVDAENYLMQDY